MSTQENRINDGALRRPARLLAPASLPHIARCGEVRLASAILEDAFRCILKRPVAVQGRRAKEFHEAHQWFTNDNRDWPFAFPNVCDLLALDAAAVRKRVQSLVALRRAEAGEQRVV